jgi:hypothetical protein
LSLRRSRPPSKGHKYRQTWCQGLETLNGAQPSTILVLAQTATLYVLNKRKLELYGGPARNRDALLAQCPVCYN